MENEIWKDVVGYEGFYQVSSTGRIKRFRSAKKNKQEHILFQTTTHHGYKRTALQKLGSIKNLFIHRIVAEAFLGSRESNLEVNHINSIRSDNRPDNLEYVTRSKNQKLAMTKKSFGYQKTNTGYQAKIWIYGKHYCLGTFKEECEAKLIYSDTHFEFFGYRPWG